jgi:hypothetical protein
MKHLTDLDPATLAAIAKLVEKAADVNRPNLLPGEYPVRSVVALELDCVVKVAEDQNGVSTPQKARPWNLVHVLLEEANRIAAAAGLAGIDLAKIVKMADAVNKDLADAACAAADAEMAALKEPTRQNRKGQVRVKGACGLPDAPEGDREAAE